METVIGGLFNAVAFAGAGFLFSKLNHSGYEKEIKRHNEAMEKLSEAKEKWYEEQVKRKEEIERLRQQLSDANADINKTNMSLKNLAEAQQRDRPEVSSTGGLSTKGAAAKLQEENKKVKTINKNDYEITKCKPSTMLSCIENL